MGITDAQYQAGIDRIRLAIAEARGEEAVFSTDLPLRMVVGFLSEDGSPESVLTRPMSNAGEIIFINNFSAYVGVFQRMSALKFVDSSPESASKRLS